MSWTTGQCECGDTVDYGIFYSEHEDTHSEINVTVICGECVRERDGIPSDDEIDLAYQFFEGEVAKNSMIATINWSQVDDELHNVLLMICKFHAKNSECSEDAEPYIKAAFSMLKTMPKQIFDMCL